MRHLGLGLVLSLLISCGSKPEPPPNPAASQQPEPHPGLSNFAKISDGLYRGAQPEPEGFKTLKAMGIKTVINLRTFHSDRKACEAAGLQYVPISVQAWEGEDEEVIDFLRTVSDPANLPVFVHCQHGADRTGVMSAVYRMVIQDWPKEKAIEEMTDGGYGFHRVWQNLIDYVEGIDVDALKAELQAEDNEINP